MEGHIALWMWLAAAAFFITGLLMGMAFGRSDTSSAQRVKELEAELQQSREESAKYHEQVSQHFMQTADLLHSLTANYRAVYEHLADGAQNLCAGQVRSLTPAALRERLLSTNHTDTSETNTHAAAPPGGEQESPLGTDTVKAEILTTAPAEEKHEAENSTHQHPNPSLREDRAS